VISLADACQFRSNELTRILAGCVAMDPCWTLPLVEKLLPGALTDNNARRYIVAVKEKLPELKATDGMDQCRIVVRIAGDNNLLSDYISWIFLPSNLYQDTPDAIAELQALAITENTLSGLQDWIKDTEELIAWH
jgi:hypothetical protein